MSMIAQLVAKNGLSSMTGTSASSSTSMMMKSTGK
ncbi:hypothetical protein A2U01_0083492, partial [Trifolium medium]|nr:hypothetical protein [Trifolium medium]